MSFDAAFARTVGLEGKYSNLPNDPGGETAFGVTAAVARSHGYLGAMRDMPLTTAKAIYQASYWDLIHLGTVDKISSVIAAKMFDTGVNCGVSIPVPFLQRALNAFNLQGVDYPDMPVDGLFGATTAAALQAFLNKRGSEGQKVILAALNAEQAMRYLEIVEKRPASESFVFGWFANRVVAA
jgi:lysozyme family protein